MTTKVSVFEGQKHAFAKVIQACLAARDSDAIFRTCWIKEDAEGRPFIVEVPIGMEHRIFLYSRSVDWTDTQAAQREGERYAKALINLRKAEKSLLRYVGGIRAEARRKINDGRDEGLDVRLSKVDFRTTCVNLLAFDDWRMAANYVLCDVYVEGFGFDLERETTAVAVEEREDVADALQGYFDDQEELESKIAELDRLAADFWIDDLELALLRDSGVDIADTMRRLKNEDALEIDLAQNQSLTITKCRGVVRMMLDGPEYWWNGTTIYSKDRNRDQPVNAPSDITEHPVLTRQPVESSSGNEFNRSFVFTRGDRSLVDADAGRIWLAPPV